MNSTHRVVAQVSKLKHHPHHQIFKNDSKSEHIRLCINMPHFHVLVVIRQKIFSPYDVNENTSLCKASSAI